MEEDRKRKVSAFMYRKMNQKRKIMFLSRLLPVVILLAAVFLIGNAFITSDYKERIVGWRSTVRIERTKPKTCEVQCRPPGSETLPKGIVSPTSDLEMRPLWAPQSKTKPKPMSLLAMAVGIKQKENVNKIIMKFPSNLFVVMLFHYDGMVNDWSEYEWSERAVHVSAIGQTKWWFAKRFLHPDIVSVYSYIFLWDEDLGVDHFDARRYVSIIKEEGLEISQPALDPKKSSIHHRITARISTARVHRRILKRIGRKSCNENSTGPPCAGFVEVMAPVFSLASWRCAWYMIQSDMKYGWGVDFQLGYCAQGDRTKNMGVVDSEYIVHYNLPTLGGLDGNKKDAELPYQAANKTSLLNTQQSVSKHEESPGRAEAVKQSFIELEAFKSRWRRAVKKDECWIDPYQPNNHKSS